MTAKDDGGPAFPTMDAGEADRCPSLSGVGMSLRDWFAGQCIVGNCNWAANENDLMLTAKAAYKLADAMLKARGV